MLKLKKPSKLEVKPRKVDTFRILGCRKSVQKNPELLVRRTFKHRWTNRTGFVISPQVHHSAVDKPNLCQTCGKGFENEMVLREHTKSVHEKDPQIICSSCGETFFNRKSHRRHMPLRHAQRNLRCLHCDKNLPDEVGKLGLHISIHTGIKPFKCAHW